MAVADGKNTVYKNSTYFPSGEGGFGAVYVAKDDLTKQMVAIKIEDRGNGKREALRMEQDILDFLSGTNTDVFCSCLFCVCLLVADTL